MAADIFISFPSKDVKIASTVCSALESRGFACWIAARDILPGENFQVAIVRALRRAKIMLLVFTANSNTSEEMTKELALASQQRMMVIPLRIEDVAPNEAFAYEFATRQWIDMFADWEASIDQLSRRIGRALENHAPEVPAAELVTPEMVALESAPPPAAKAAPQPAPAAKPAAKVAKAAPPPEPEPAPEPTVVSAHEAAAYDGMDEPMEDSLRRRFPMPLRLALLAATIAIVVVVGVVATRNMPAAKPRAPEVAVVAAKTAPAAAVAVPAPAQAILAPALTEDVVVDKAAVVRSRPKAAAAQAAAKEDIPF